MNLILVLSSVTYALKAQDLFKREGIYSTLTKSSAVSSVRGCGYGIKINSSYRNTALKILKDNGIVLLGSVEERVR